ncbi:hypothetical protein ATCC90586_002878 [Pythium insidiosum]|nr:hypothetical protein ATCC90586_002878 [Pythium insidiosum]
MTDTFVFVYGTLKRGFFNFESFVRPAIERGKAEYLCDGLTVASDLCLVLRKERQVPALYRATPGETGYRVPGEVFRVDADVLKALDILEGVAEANYYREEVEIELTTAAPAAGWAPGDVVRCQIYFKVFDASLAALDKVPEYTAALHAAYSSRRGTPMREILACIVGPTDSEQEQQ